MRRWGIRIIGIFFLFGAATTYFDIITKKNPPRGFLGISFSLFSGPSPESMISQLDIMALIGLCVYVYIAYNLLKFRDQGRLWALAILWLSILRLALAFIYTAITMPIPLTSIKLIEEYFGHSYILDQPGIFIVFTCIGFLFLAIPIYFLMRRDVKMEFQIQGKSEPNPATE